MFSGLFIGIAFGILLQRTQFCFVSGFRRFLFEKKLPFFNRTFNRCQCAIYRAFYAS